MLSCGHERNPLGSPVCVHLRTCEEDTLICVRWYVGSGTDAELLCRSCAQQRETGATVVTGRVCEECYEHGMDIAEVEQVAGAPEVRSCLRPIDTAVRQTPLPELAGNVVDLAPVDEALDSTWITLSDDGWIARFNACSGAFTRLVQVSVAPDPAREQWMNHAPVRRLHASPCGRFAAVVIDYGCEGELLDLKTRRVTLRMHGGEYHANTVPFSFAFARVAGRTIAIHRTAWNRLDLCDPETGGDLAARLAPAREDEHYRDYFHGAVFVSPDGRLVVDDGWRWHPSGAVSTWNLEAWLTNRWESEDGPTQQELCDRAYFWGSGITWLSDRLVAVQGIGEHEDAMIEGARVFDAVDGHEVNVFAGPAGRFLSDGGSLFSVDAAGTTRWDPTEGCRTGEVPGFHPTRFHKGARELAEISDGVLTRWATT